MIKNKRQKFNKKNRIERINNLSIGNLLFFKRHSNLFFVLCNYDNKHLITLTSGTCKMGKTKKQKISAYHLSSIMNVLSIYLNKHKIKYINFIFRQRITNHFYNFQRLLKLNNFLIHSYKYILKRPHGFYRGRTQRRI
jgi:hypothetical protein